jgi:spore maturation protein CgeB
MKVMVVWPMAKFSIWDVARGYENALQRLGCWELFDYRMDRRASFWIKSLRGTSICNEDGEIPSEVLAEQVSEAVVIEAMKYQVDFVLIVSGLSFHPNALWLLRRAGIRAGVILTESPYEDANQALLIEQYPEMLVFTNDKGSAEEHGWQYLPAAYDPLVHQPASWDDEISCDVLIVGTGWKERQELLEQVNWEGIELHVLGLWLGIDKESPLAPYYAPSLVPNEQIPRLYSSAKICVNQYRGAGYSLNPRAYEIPACGGFQLSDHRPELSEVFGDAVPTYDGARELEEAIRFFLADEGSRLRLAQEQRRLVEPHSFDERARQVVAAVEKELAPVGA